MTPLSACDPGVLLAKLASLGGPSPAIVVACPEYPDTPDSVLDTLEAQAQTDQPTGQYLIDQSKLADQLDACNGIDPIAVIDRK